MVYVLQLSFFNLISRSTMNVQLFIYYESLYVAVDYLNLQNVVGDVKLS